MKKNYKILLAIIIFCLSIPLFSQTPQCFNYQAVCRDNLGNIIASQSIDFLIIIRNDSISGPDIYHEYHTVTSNQFGLVTFQIGKGTGAVGIFSNINWGSDKKFLDVQMNNGGGWIAIGTQQLISVPYALYAEKSGTTSGPQISFGSWASRSANTVYYADTDGFVLVQCGVNNGGDMYIKSDSNPSPTTVRASAGTGSGTTAVTLTLTSPVRKGDYWNAANTGNITAIMVQWIPLN